MSNNVFPPLSGFEDVELRVEVNWRESTRPVVARLEALPISPPVTVLVCRFEDAPLDGEWLVLHPDGCGPFPITRPNRAAKLRRIVRDSFAQHNSNIGRAIHDPELEAPNIALLVPPAHGEWLENWAGSPRKGEETTPFTLSHPIEALTKTQTRELLHHDCNDEHSDARFAWHWSHLTHAEKLTRLGGFDGQWSDLKRLMTYILQITPALWENGSIWGWALHHKFSSYSWLVNLSNRTDTTQATRLNRWSEWLFAHFMPHFQTQLATDHPCVEQFWEYLQSLESVRVQGPPSFHEQLEARLELRDWLQDKATPTEIDTLITS